MNFQQKTEFVEALLLCSSMSDRHTRDAIVNDLPLDIRTTISRSSVDRTDVMNIVKECLHYPNAIQNLIEIVRFYEGNSIGIQAIDKARENVVPEVLKDFEHHPRKFKTITALDIDFNELSSMDQVDLDILTAPPLPAYYIERKSVMEQVRATLLDREGGASIAISGMSGVGKTILATALAHDEKVQNTFHHGILWATLGPQIRTNEHIRPWLIAWGASLGLNFYPDLQTEVLVSLLTNSLRRRRCLLILDDVWSVIPATILTNLRGARCGVVLTTREQDIAVNLGAKSVDLGVMLPCESKLLIEQRLAREIHQSELADIEELLIRLGHLPLAVSLAAAQAKLGTTWGEMLNALRKVQPNLEILDFSRPEVRTQSLEASFDLTYERLDQDSQRRYRMLGVLAPNATFFLEDIIPLWFVEPKKSKAIAFELTRDPAEVRAETEKGLRDFVIRGILRRVTNQQGEIYQQHPLLRLDALRRLQSQERMHALELHAAWVRLIVGYFTDAQKYGVFRRADAQISAVLRRLQRGYSEVSGLAILTGNEAKQALAMFVLSLTGFWLQERRYMDLIEWTQEAAKCCRDLGELALESAHLGNLGAAYVSIGDIDQGISFLRESLEIDRRLGRKIGEVVNLHNLSSALAEQGKTQQAVEMAYVALDIAREIGSKKREIESLVLITTHLSRQEDFEGAKSLLSQALEIAVSENQTVLNRNILHMLGDVCLSLNDFEAALVHLHRALAINQELSDEFCEVDVVSLLGEAMLKVGQEEEAIKYLDYSLQLAERIIEEKSMSRSLSNLAIAYLNLGETKKAKQFCERALALDRKYGNLRHELGDLRILLAIQEKQGHKRLCVETLNNTLEIAKQLQDLKEQGITFSLLAMMYVTLGVGNTTRALEFGKRALIIHEKLKDEDAIIDDLLLLGHAHVIPGRFSASCLIYYWRALTWAERIGHKQKQMESYIQIGRIYKVIENPLLEWQVLARARKLAEELNDSESLRSLKTALNVLHRKFGHDLDIPGFAYDRDYVANHTTAQLAAWVVEGCKGNQELGQKAYDIALAYQGKPGSDQQPFIGSIIGFDSANQVPHKDLGWAFQRMLEGLRGSEILEGLSGPTYDIVVTVLEQISQTE